MEFTTQSSNLLEIAPVDKHWLRVLYDLLDQLDFQQVARPETYPSDSGRLADYLRV